MKHLDVDNFLDYLENKLLIIKDNMRKREVENSMDTDKYYRLQIQRETLENVSDIFYKLCSPWKNSEKMNSIKTIEFIKTFHPTEESMYPVVVAKYDNKYYLLNTFAVASSSVSLVKEVTTEYPNGYHELLIDEAINQDDYYSVRTAMAEFIQRFNQLKEESE